MAEGTFTLAERLRFRKVLANFLQDLACVLNPDCDGDSMPQALDAWKQRLADAAGHDPEDPEPIEGECTDSSCSYCDGDFHDPLLDPALKRPYPPDVEEAYDARADGASWATVARDFAYVSASAACSAVRKAALANYWEWPIVQRVMPRSAASKPVISPKKAAKVIPPKSSLTGFGSDKVTLGEQAYNLRKVGYDWFKVALHAGCASAASACSSARSWALRYGHAWPIDLSDD